MVLVNCNGLVCGWLLSLAYWVCILVLCLLLFVAGLGLIALVLRLMRGGDVLLLIVVVCWVLVFAVFLLVVVSSRCLICLCGFAS